MGMGNADAVQLLLPPFRRILFCTHSSSSNMPLISFHSWCAVQLTWASKLIEVLVYCTYLLALARRHWTWAALSYTVHAGNC